jgi:hypothetical protein
MPIAASLPIMIPMLQDAYSQKEKAKPDVIAKKISDAIAAACLMGFLPVGPAMIPLIPAGASIGAMLIAQGFSFPIPVPDVIALIIAAGIAVIAPMCPPSGLSSLQSSLKEVMNLGSSATPIQMATKTAQAVVTYYQSGGII